MPIHAPFDLVLVSPYVAPIERIKSFFNFFFLHGIFHFGSIVEKSTSYFFFFEFFHYFILSYQ
jgi:hypothetical protein